MPRFNKLQVALQALASDTAEISALCPRQGLTHRAAESNHLRLRWLVLLEISTRVISISAAGSSDSLYKWLVLLPPYFSKPCFTSAGVGGSVHGQLHPGGADALM